MPEAPAFERLVKRERVITLAALAMLTALTWLYTLMGAGMSMSAWEMTTLALFPHQHASEVAGMNMAVPTGSTAWMPSTWVLMIAMWWVMMVAMMTPSATPAILLFARVQRHAPTQAHAPSASRLIVAFAAGYLLSWLAFAVLATALHWGLESAGLISAMMMQSRSRWLSGALLIIAGCYQLSPFKRMCLAHCHSPASFLSRHWRSGIAGALRLGVIHGSYCIGCCWLLMALLFVGGVMNVVWIALLASLVMLEKLLRAGPWIARATSVALIGWGLATLVV